MIRRSVLALVFTLTSVPSITFAQAQSGEIFGKVVDTSGAVVPGVSVTLTSPSLITPQTVITLESGAYRFPNVPIGTYAVTFEIPGFKRVVREGVRIETGFNAEINTTLEVSTVQETVTVTGESPIVDTRATSTGQTFTREMLERIPSARDPWVVMEQTPGILMNQQNVGGNKSGQQSTFIAHGTGNNEVWNVDGGNITDMSASSASVYFDFDAYEEMQIQTGGSDASVQSSGVAINLVTKSGGNNFHGSSRLFVVDNNLQGDNISAELQAQGAGSGNPIKNIKDYGAEIGGPIVRNKMWFWGAAGYNDIEVGVVGFVRPGGDPNNPEDLNTDLTTLKTYNAKLQYQWSAPHKSSFLYFFNDKNRNAREAGPTRAPETVFVQTAPVSTFKGSHYWIPTSRLTLEFQAMKMPNGGFFLNFPDESLETVQSALDLTTNYQTRSHYREKFDRPQTEVRADGNYFLTSFLGGDHATKFGIGYRDTPFSAQRHRGGFAQARFTGTAATAANPFNDEANLYRDSFAKTALTQLYGYFQDSYKRGRMTLNGGIRFDRQNDEALASHVDANPLIPQLLPAVDFAGADSGVTFFDWSPRLGVTWDLTGDGKTVVKSNYAVYWGTGITTAASVNPVSEVQLRYPSADVNGDRFIQANELDLTRRLTSVGQLRSGESLLAAVLDDGRSQPEERPHRRVLDRHRARADGQLRRWRRLHLPELPGLRELHDDAGRVLGRLRAGELSCHLRQRVVRSAVVHGHVLPTTLHAPRRRLPAQRRPHAPISRARAHGAQAVQRSLDAQCERELPEHDLPLWRARRVLPGSHRHREARWRADRDVQCTVARETIRPLRAALVRHRSVRLLQPPPGVSVQPSDSVADAHRRHRARQRRYRSLGRRPPRKLLSARHARGETDPVGRHTVDRRARRVQPLQRGDCSSREEIQNINTANNVEEVLAPRVARLSIRMKF